MADDTPSQKDLSDRYQRHLRYFHPRHALRRRRLWMFVGVAAVTVLGVASFRYWGRDSVFSPGPLSATHAHLVHDCQKCHARTETDLFTAPPAWRISSASLEQMDASCKSCHPAKDLHAPQPSQAAMRPSAAAVAEVHVSGCATCHREHAGTRRMGVPERETCVECHASTERMKLTRQLLDGGNKTIKAEGEVHDLGDGVRRFLSPARSAAPLPAFASFASDHPPFGYEHPARRDPAPLKFNHERHLRGDVKIKGRALDCATCHQPGEGGTHRRPIDYETHCQQCHSLQIHPDLPDLRVPHGDPGRTRYFLAGLKETLTPEQNAVFKRADLVTLADLEERIYFGGRQTDRDALRPGDRKATECRKCHTVEPGRDGAVPDLKRPAIAERWFQHGPFPHEPHRHIDCLDCHAKAPASTKTEDILLPPKSLCVECHRPAGSAAPTESQLRVSLESEKSAQVAREVKNGGIKADCQSCHSFHAPANAPAEILAPLLPSEDKPVR
jgi:hypothetical protein